jgi:hypothetical protein
MSATLEVFTETDVAEMSRRLVETGTDLVEYYFEQGWTDGLPIVPPTPEKIEAMVEALGGDPHAIIARVAPRWGVLTVEVLAINMVIAGCKPEYAPVVKAAALALTDPAFNLNGVQATTHVASPLVIVNGPVARQIGMNSGCNAFGSGTAQTLRSVERSGWLCSMSAAVGRAISTKARWGTPASIPTAFARTRHRVRSHRITSSTATSLTIRRSS